MSIKIFNDLKIYAAMLHKFSNLVIFKSLFIG